MSGRPQEHRDSWVLYRDMRDLETFICIIMVEVTVILIVVLILLVLT